MGFLSKRWNMVLLIFSGLMVGYTLRVNISVAVQDMRDDLNWTESEKGFVLSAFYWGYALGQIPASKMAQKYGAKWIFGMSILIPSLLTLLVPIAARDSLISCLILRMITGIFAACMAPCYYHYIPIWIPLEEKTFLIPVIQSGCYMGEILGFALSGVLVDADILIDMKQYGGWPSVFYIFGLFGICWFPIWAYCAVESPETHPTITKEELNLIRKGKHGGTSNHDQLDRLIDNKEISASDTTVLTHTRSAFNHQRSERDEGIFDSFNANTEEERADETPEQQQERTLNFSIDSQGGGPGHDLRSISQIEDASHHAMIEAGTPWWNILTHPAALTLYLNAWVTGWISFTLLSEMPSYLTDVLGFDLGSAGMLSVFPFIALFAASVNFGKFFNYLQLHHGWKVNTVRQVSMYVSYVGSCGSLIICAFITDKYTAYGFMILSQFFYGACVAGLNCAYSDMSPNYSPIMNAIANSVSAVGGFVGPLVVAALTTAYPGIDGWRAAFYLTAAMAVCGLISWSIYQTSEIVPEINTPKPRKL